MIDTEVYSEKIIEIIKKTVDFECNIGKDVKLEDMGINSLLFIRVVVALEEMFDIEFDGESLNYENFKTVDDVANYIAQEKMRV